VEQCAEEEVGRGEMRSNSAEAERCRSGADGEKKEKKEKKEGFYGMKREMRRLNLRVP